MTVPFLQAIQPPTIKVKVKRAVPFLTVRSGAIRLKVLPMFPAALVGGTGIAVERTEGVYRVSLDIEKLQDQATSSESFVILWDAVGKQFSRVTISDLKQLMGL